ncbi:MAG: hypothetical protein K8U03_06510 [Planctomycetia bacterium]|nr:hypothetical protein [Planctomycetia bacterium]
MLSNIVVEEIRRLLAEGKLSQRAISKQTGISRGTITAISMNRRNERVPRREEPLDADLGPPARCPTCGGTVYMPCRLCRVRDAKFGPGRDRRPSSSHEGPLDRSRMFDRGGPNERRPNTDSSSERPAEARSMRLPGR